MKKTVFQYLEWSNPKSIANSAEEEFFYHHASYFNQKSNIYNDTSSVYGIIRACIVLESARNKEKLDYYVTTYPKKALEMSPVTSIVLNKLPFYEIGEDRIYIPTLSKEINDLYYRNIAELTEPKYQDVIKNSLNTYVDPFETYGVELFNSTFTRLIKLDVCDEKTFGFYHPYLETFLILDEKGCLLKEIPLFDEKLKHPNKDNLFSRLDELMTSYLDGDRNKFLEDLKRLEFISKSLYDDITYYINK